VVDELTEDQTRAILVPTPKTKRQLEQVRIISDLAMRSVGKRVEAVRFAEDAVTQIDVLVPPIERPATTDHELDASERFQSLAQRLAPALRSGIQPDGVNKKRRSHG